MKRLFLTIALVGCSWIILTASYTPSEKKSTAILTDIATERSFDITVHSVGELDAVRSTMVSSELQGDKGKILWIVEDGARVAKGDVLVRFDSSEFEETVRQLTDKIKEQEARISAHEQILAWEKSQVEREIQNAQFDLQAAKLDLIKLEKGEGPLELARFEEATNQAKNKFTKFQKYASDLENYRKLNNLDQEEIADVLKKVEEAKSEFHMTLQKYECYRDYVLPTNIEKAKANVAKMNVNLEQKKKGGGFKIGKAHANLRLSQRELESTRALLQKAQSDLQKTVIKATIPGMAVLREAFHKGAKRKPRIGDKVLRNQPIVYLPDVSLMMVKTKIREIDLHKVAPGKPVLIRVDAYPDLILNGKVESIGVLAQPDPSSKAREKYFTIDILVSDSDHRLRPGMTARLEIRCSVTTGLTIPVQAVFYKEEKIYAYFKRGERFEKRQISIAGRNVAFVQVVSGLKKGDYVALTIPDDSLIINVNTILNKP